VLVPNASFCSDYVSFCACVVCCAGSVVAGVCVVVRARWSFLSISAGWWATQTCCMLATSESGRLVMSLTSSFLQHQQLVRHVHKIVLQHQVQAVAK
jgi:hypothetical protein